MRKKKAGHRSWRLINGKVAGRHNGDIMSVEARSRVMSQIKGKNTTPERIIVRELRQRKIYFATHATKLPGKPDIVFRRIKLAVFIDGDFWHGWRLPLWNHKLSEKWQNKIARTRERDQQHFRQLRGEGWTVLRIWEHQVEQSLHDCVERILSVRSSLLKKTD
ncbi:MAG: very short patch repair endonuclease [Thermoguttaceae bacterium]|jgi:DNA mismatch endonuclease (patch repair protein)|nr:very short patch repair endonuclease [Thermoguttaceae bacterium]